MSQRPVWRATPQSDAFIREVFTSRKGIIAVQTVFDIDTDTQLWWRIPGFNGYEMSDYGYIRSMKYFQRLPFGMLIKFDNNEYYTLSDDNNDRIKVHRMDLWDLVVTNPYTEPGYPRSTNQTDCYSRNRRMFLADQDLPLYGTRGYGKNIKRGNVKRKHVQTNKKEPTFFPKFTVVDDDNPDGIDILEFVNK